MRTVTLVVLLFAALASATGFAPLVKLHKEGVRSVEVAEDTCGTTLTCATSGQACSLTAICTSANTYCASGTCTATKANGQACTSGASCTSGGCFNGVCASISVANGGACTSDLQCESDNCVNSVCVGASVGQACTSSDNCNIDGTDCVSGVCTMPLNIGAACSVLNDRCAGGLACGASSTCVVYYSVAAGAACNYNYECAQGLSCINSVCNAPPASSGTSCTGDSGCTAANEECACNYGTGQGTCTNVYTAIPSGANSVSTQIRSCYTGACASTPTGVCVEDKCRGAFCAAETFILNFSKAQYKQYYPSCLASALDRELTAESECGGSSSAVPLAASAVVLAFAATVTIAFGL